MGSITPLLYLQTKYCFFYLPSYLKAYTKFFLTKYYSNVSAMQGNYKLVITYCLKVISIQITWHDKHHSNHLLISCKRVPTGLLIMTKSCIT